MSINKNPQEPIRDLMAEERVIGIVGGVGPEAGTLLHRYIINESVKTKEIKCDQDHFVVVHISASPFIADRTDFLLNKYGESAINPAEGVFKAIQMIAKAAQGINKKVVLGVPCNTFHAPPVFNKLKELIKNSEINEQIEILHMIEETKNYLQKNYTGIKKIGLMSTTGTREQEIYPDFLKPLGYEIIEVDTETQKELHDSIYNSEWGIKAVSPVTEKAKNNFEKYAKILTEKGAEAIVLGCTEIPLALPQSIFNNIPLIDPMRALAQGLVKKAI